jgi:hypothetical protein
MFYQFVVHNVGRTEIREPAYHFIPWLTYFKRQVQFKINALHHVFKTCPVA